MLASHFHDILKTVNAENNLKIYTQKIIIVIINCFNVNY